MRKTALLMVLWFLLSVCVHAVSAVGYSGDAPEDDATEAFHFPSSLKTIGDEAFSGTAVKSVVLPDSVESIGARAFANNDALKTVYIPASVNYIGDQAFEGSSHTMIQAAEDSYAAAWARENNIACVQTESAGTRLSKLRKLLQGSFFLSLNFAYLLPVEQNRQRRRKAVFEVSMRPQDRPELYPINYRFP